VAPSGRTRGSRPRGLDTGGPRARSRGRPSLLRGVEPRARRSDAGERARLLIRAVLFDAGGTLLHADPPFEEVYARVFTEDGARFSQDELRAALGAAWLELQREKPDDRYGGVSGEVEFWREFVQRTRRRLGSGDLSESAFARLAAHFQQPESWALYPDSVPTLEALAAQGLALAIVSNWDSQLPRLLELRGLAAFFQVVSVSAIEETGKPGREIFLRTCKRLSIAPADALHVGDSLRDDFEGARGAGLSALLLDRGGHHPDVAELIRSLSDILPPKFA
jgi:putative hydrolase of the HAD superfamily